jgi:hypothetical protein
VCVQEANTAAQFAPYARAILAHMGNFYQSSAADLFAVVSAYCPLALNPDVKQDPAIDDIPTSLYVRFLPLKHACMCDSDWMVP